MEIQRCANILPIGLQHMSHKDFTVNGVTIPARTTIQTLFAAIMKGDHWEEGTKFKPERFLDSEGQVRRDDHFIPFSVGEKI